MLLNAAFRPVHTVAAAPAPARATIDACAPWDGPAFVLTIPSDDTTSTSVVTVAIWQEARRLTRPTVFRLPDNTGRVGVASLLTHAGKREDLAGSISFDSVAAGKWVIGSINFTSAGGLSDRAAIPCRVGNKTGILWNLITLPKPEVPMTVASSRIRRRLAAALVLPPPAH